LRKAPRTLSAFARFRLCAIYPCWPQHCTESPHIHRFHDQATSAF
jgi:hypothetical protein